MIQPSFAIVAFDEEAEAAESLLRSLRQTSRRLTVVELADEVRKGLVTALIASAEELSDLDLAAFRQALEQQPPWSDLPILLFVHRENARLHSARLDELGQVRLIERPLDSFIFERAVLAALRSRQRQAGARALMERLGETQRGNIELTETLEQRVLQRTEQLESAYRRLLREAEERHTAEERLRESEELYRYTIELSQQIVWVADADGTYQSITPRYSEITGLDPAEPQSRAVHPDDRERVMAAWKASVARGTDHSVEYRLCMRDGGYRYFRARAAPLRDAEGRIVRWYGTTEDVHEQKQAEQARVAAEERYELAARATNDVIWDLDLVTDEIHWSDSASPSFGYAGGRAPTDLHWWEERIHPDDRDRVSASLKSVVRSSRTRWSANYRFLNAEGVYSNIYDRGFIIRDESGKAVRAVGAMSDVSDRVNAEAQLQRMQAELIHVSRVSAMGTMASTLAHELNQPLTAVTSYVGGSRRLLQDSKDPVITRVREALESAESAALRAGRIVRGLRELVARGHVNVKPEDLRNLIHDASVLAFVDQHLLGVTHRIEVDPSVDWVDADRIQIQQVLINLIRNSVQAMADQRVREVVISAKAVAGGMVELCVSDTGVGLSPEVQEALFSPFRSTKAEGMGIGLSISRTIVEAHGGKIWAENRPEGGAVFRFTVPKAEQPAADAKQAAE